jgi:tetratricopeptide (TPR) repeat protein
MAMRYAQEALDFCSDNNFACPTVMVLYAHILGVHAVEIPKVEDIHRAISICRSVIPLLHTTDHHLSISARATLADIIHYLFLQTRNAKELDASIKLGQMICSEIRSSRSHCHSDLYPLLLSRLGHRLQSRYERLQRIDDLDEGTSCCRAAVQLCSQIHLDRIPIIGNTLIVLYVGYHRSGAHQILDEALDLGRQARHLAQFQSYRRRSWLLNTTASLLTAHYLVSQPSGRSADEMEEIIALSREVLLCSQSDDSAHWAHAGNLANRLSLQFSITGDLANLEEAINIARKSTSMDTHSERDPAWLSLSFALAHTLGLRFQETRDISDLEEALRWKRYFMVIASPTEIRYCGTAIDMVSYLCTRFEILHFPDDLEEAISLAEQLLASPPTSAISEPAIIREASRALLLCGRHNHDLTYIDKVLQTIAESSVKLSNSVYGPESFRILAMAHLDKFRLTGDSNQAVSARNVMISVLDTLPLGHYERYEYLAHIAEIFMEPGTPFQDTIAAFEYFTQAIIDVRRDVRSKLRGASRFLQIVETKHKDIFVTQSRMSSQLLEIYASAIALLPRVAFFGLHYHSRLQALVTGQSIALTGASLALNLSLPERALEILEQGRAVFWTHTLRLRSPFDSVPEQHRKRLLALARKLEKISNIFHVTGNTELIERETADRRKQSEEFNVLLEEVRSLPGLERFLLHDRYPALTKAAKIGPVVVLVSSTIASHAIIMRPSGEAAGISLDSVADTWLLNSSSVWRSAVTEARSVVRDGLKMVKKVASQKSPRLKIDEILRDLWVRVVKPVLVNLGIEVGSPACYATNSS